MFTKSNRIHCIHYISIHYPLVNSYNYFSTSTGILFVNTIHSGILHENYRDQGLLEGVRCVVTNICREKHARYVERRGFCYTVAFSFYSMLAVMVKTTKKLVVSCR